MSNNNKIGGIYSWPIIILALVIFWPVGLFLIIKRISLDKKAAISSGGKGLKAIGITLIVLGALGFIGLVSEPTEGSGGGIAVAIFFIAGGIALIIKSKKVAKEAESVKQYLSIIINGGERHLDTIAASTGRQYDVVKADVQNMIDKGFLRNAYINESTREIIFTTPEPVNNAGQATYATTTEVQTKIVTCPCCGANNTVVGDISECEYCGTPLK